MGRNQNSPNLRAKSARKNVPDQQIQKPFACLHVGGASPTVQELHVLQVSRREFPNNLRHPSRSYGTRNTHLRPTAIGPSCKRYRGSLRTTCPQTIQKTYHVRKARPLHGAFRLCNGPAESTVCSLPLQNSNSPFVERDVKLPVQRSDPPLACAEWRCASCLSASCGYGKTATNRPEGTSSGLSWSSALGCSRPRKRRTYVGLQ